jgi:hypothetical protein
MRAKVNDYSKEFGQLFRFLFFAASACALALIVHAFNWSVLTTPFGELTVAAVAMAASRVTLIVAGVYLWIVWAFAGNDETRSYGNWNGLALLALIAWIAWIVLLAHFK